MDESYNAIHAAKKAIEIQKRENSEVVGFHSILHHLSELNLSFFNPKGLSDIKALSIHNDYIQRGEHILEDLDKIFKESKAKVETRLIFDITPEDYIQYMIEEEGFDLVILGCKGHHSKLGRIFLGSIPRNVINYVESDILLVR